MTTSSTDPREIEAELERDRATLASTLDELSDRVSVDSLARDALNTVKSYAGSYTSTLDGAVRTNPIAVALVGAGLAWLAFSGHRRSTASTSGDGYVGGPVHDDLSRLDSEGGIPAASGLGSYAGGTPVGSSSGDDHSWWDSIQDLQSKATAALHRIEREAASALGSVRDHLPGMGGSSSGGGRDYESERASVISGFTSGLRERFSSGLDSLPEPARQRIVAARERAYAASLQAERVGRQAITDPARALEEHPLVAGAVAFALGAAAAVMLPRTEAEDRAFGGERDRLMEEAARLLRTERERAMQIAGGLVDEAKSAASDIMGEVRAAATEAVGDVVDTAKEKATGLASLVAERATEEASRLADDATQGGVGGGQGAQGSSAGSQGLSQATAQGGDQGGMRGSGDPVIG
jgi:vacuolar-type H+-ATPase subunit H